MYDLHHGQVLYLGRDGRDNVQPGSIFLIWQSDKIVCNAAETARW
jgi:hypothetical protein